MIIILSPSYIDSIPDELVILYSIYELSVLEDIARRISKMNYLTPTAEFQLEQLKESMLVYQNTVTQLSKLTGKSEEEIAIVFESAGIETLSVDDAVYKANGLTPLPIAQNTAMVQLLAINAKEVQGTLVNLTRTTAVNSQQLFYKATSLAHLQVQSGAFTSDQAIKNAVKLASNDGLLVTYPSGVQRSVESAVRSNVLTGVNQTALKLQDMRADEVGSNLVEVTAHAGARDGEGYKGHVNWQGKVFRRKGSNKKYKNFAESTGYGKVDGLGGANCRHSWFPFFERQERAYTKELLKSYKKDDVIFNDKKLSYYEATQKQRHYERNIRKWKTEANMMKAAGQDPMFANKKVREWQSKTRDLVDQTGVNRQYTRERIA